jgi:hypothetical protein
VGQLLDFAIEQNSTALPFVALRDILRRDAISIANEEWRE